jgi:hypothetical protein
MDFFVGGYFLVQGVQSPSWMKKALLPTKFWTISQCICEIYPDSWVFSWSTKSSHNDKDYQAILNLDDDTFQLMQTWANEMFSKGELGWPHVFMNLATARQFYLQYLQHIPDIKLFSIALSDAYWAEFIEENKPKPGTGAGGIYQKLLQKQVHNGNAIIRGFEILGEEWGEWFHSFVCNSLGDMYVEQLHISLNQNGLIDRYEDAVRATNYTNLDEVGAEPVLWQPWLISEYSLSG